MSAKDDAKRLSAIMLKAENQLWEIVERWETGTVTKAEVRDVAIVLQAWPDELVQADPVIAWLIADFDSTQIWLRRFIDGVQQPDEVVTVPDSRDLWERFNELQSGDCPF